MHVLLHVFVLEINLFEFVFVDHDSPARDAHYSTARDAHDPTARDDEQEPGIVN